MQCSVTVVVELEAEADIVQMEQAVQEAGRQALRQALKPAVRRYEEAHAACPGCGSAASQSQGTVARRVLTRFGRVQVRLRRQRCLACRQRFRPAGGCLAALAGGNVTPGLGAACALAGASWPSATAARVLRDLAGAQVCHEEVRRWARRLGLQAADAQQREAERLLAPTAAQVRQARDTQARQERLGRSSALVCAYLPQTSALWFPFISFHLLPGIQFEKSIIYLGFAVLVFVYLALPLLLTIWRQSLTTVATMLDTFRTGHERVDTW